MKNVTLEHRKSFVRNMVTAGIVSLCLIMVGCKPSAKDILKKYDTYGETGTDTDKAGISFTVQAFADNPMISITYSCPLLNTSEDLIWKLSERWFVADAENPTVKLPVKIGVASISKTVNDSLQSITYGNTILIKADSVKSPFLLIGFEGISSTESKEAETLPLFFLVENNKADSKALTSVPRLAGELFAAGYKPVFFSEQEYSGEIPFEKSKNAALHLTLSADLKKVVKFKLSADNLYLTPENLDKQRKNLSKQESIFKYLENSTMSLDFATTKVNGYNVQAVDASGNYVISKLQLVGGFEATSLIETIDNKIKLDDRPVICDLTITNACIYGTVKVEMDDCGTKSVYAVFKNTTTPQEIPENILDK